jgi:hypothetical protein
LILANVGDLVTLNLTSNAFSGNFPEELESLVELVEVLEARSPVNRACWSRWLKPEVLGGEITCESSMLELLAEDIGCHIGCNCCCSDIGAICGYFSPVAHQYQEINIFSKV